MANLPALRRTKQHKWLIISVGIDENSTVETYIKKFAETFGVNRPECVYCCLSGKEAYSIGQSARMVDNEIDEEINIFINEVVDIIKSNRSCQDIAIIIRSHNFGNKDVFERLITDHYWSPDNMHIICYDNNFMDFKKKRDCLSNECRGCDGIRNNCVHSCFLRLMWLLFNKDDRVKDLQ